MKNKTPGRLYACLLCVFLIGCSALGKPPATVQKPVLPTAAETVITSPVVTETPNCSNPYFDPLSFFPDGSRLLVKNEHKIFVINSTTWKQDGALEFPLLINSVVALSPDGRLLALSDEANSIKLLQMTDGKILSSWNGHDDIITELKFTLSGDKLLSASHDTWVKIWDINGNLLDAFQPAGADNFPSDVLGIGISPDGKTLATIPFNGPVKLWDLTTDQQVAEMGGNGGWDTSEVSFSSDGQYLAASLATGLWVWHVSDHSILAKDINTLAFEFSPDGHMLAYSDNNHDGDVVLIDLDGMRKLHVFPGNYGWLMFSPDASLLMSTNLVETRIWQMEDGSLLYTACDSTP